MPKRWAQAAGILCADSRFWLYLDQRARAKFGSNVPDGTHIEQDAADWVRRACGVSSRGEIDGNPGAVRTLRNVLSRFQRWKGKLEGMP